MFYQNFENILNFENLFFNNDKFLCNCRYYKKMVFEDNKEIFLLEVWILIVFWIRLDLLFFLMF